GVEVARRLLEGDPLREDGISGKDVAGRPRRRSRIRDENRGGECEQQRETCHRTSSVSLASTRCATRRTRCSDFEACYASRSGRGAQVAERTIALAVSLLNLVEDRLQQSSRRKHVLPRQDPRPLSAPRGDRLADRTMLEVVLFVEVIDVHAGCPDEMREEAPPGAFRDALDERRGGGRVDHVVKGVVATH